MIQKYSTYRILQVFFDFPRRYFQLREICRIVGLTLPSVRNHIKKLEREGFIKKEKKGIYPSYVANRDYDMFKFYKRLDIIERIELSGILDYIYDSCVPSCIILFGSASRGEDIETSDIDIFIKAKERKLLLEKYERILNRKIALFFEEDFLRLNKELKNNIINGIKLRGYLKVF